MQGLSLITPVNEAQARKGLHIPPKSKEHLHRWVKVYLGIDLPDCTVCTEDDEHQPSNSNPMSMLWELYSAALAGDDPSKTYYLYYAARDSYKSLLASIMEAICLFVLKLDCGHLAAQKQQAQNVTRYLKDYLRRPILKEYTTSKNETVVEVTRYEHFQTGEIISPVQWAALESGKENYRSTYNYVQIVVATMGGTNSLHAPILIEDELDLAPPQPIQEAQMMVSQGRGEGSVDGKKRLPLIMMTSTRKFPFGLVQKAIDDAPKTGLVIRSWNMIDITERCPDERHRPDLPKIPIYRSSQTLESISEQEYKELPEESQNRFRRDEGYQGCLDNCKMFAACKGKLATAQTSKSPLLKGISYTQGLLRRVALDRAKSQLLCWKPSSEGVVYPRLNREVHMLTPAQIATKVTGENFDPHMTKSELIQLMKQREVRWYCGMDWGYTHNFACVVGFKDGNRLFVVDAIAQPELEIGQKLALCNVRIKPYDPQVFPDPAYPSDIKTFKMNGYRMRDWSKNAGSVAGGIEIVRHKLSPTLGDPELYFLANDEGVDLLVTHMSRYHFVIDPSGRVTDEPDDEEDDLPDAARYLIMNVFPPRGKNAIESVEVKPQPPAAVNQYTQDGWMRKVIAEHTGQLQHQIDAAVDGSAPLQGKKGGFHFSL